MQAWGCRRNLVLRRLLLLGGRRRRRSETGLTAAAVHDCAKDIASQPDGRRLLRRAGMLRRAAHSARRSTTTRIGKLATEVRDLVFVFLFQRQMGLFHGIHFLAHELHFLSLRLHLMIKILRGAQLAFEFGADLVEELAKTADALARGNTPHTAMSWIHRHDCSASQKCVVGAAAGEVRN